MCAQKLHSSYIDTPGENFDDKHNITYCVLYCVLFFYFDFNRYWYFGRVLVSIILLFIFINIIL